MEDMVSKLKKPRRVMLLVKAGAAVDAFIDKLVIVISLSNLTFRIFQQKRNNENPHEEVEVNHLCISFHT